MTPEHRWDATPRLRLSKTQACWTWRFNLSLQGSRSRESWACDAEVPQYSRQKKETCVALDFNPSRMLYSAPSSAASCSMTWKRPRPSCFSSSKSSFLYSLNEFTLERDGPPESLSPGLAPRLLSCEGEPRFALPGLGGLPEPPLLGLSGELPRADDRFPEGEFGVCNRVKFDRGGRELGFIAAMPHSSN